MKDEITTFVKIYFLNILLILGFVGIYIFTQFVHNEYLYEWLFIDKVSYTVTGAPIPLEKEILTNNKYYLQDFLFCLPLIGFSIFVDYFRSLFYPEKYLKRIFIACATIFILFVLNWAIFELFGNIEHSSLYYQMDTKYSPSESVNFLLSTNMFLLLFSIGLLYICEQQPIVKKFNNYIKTLLLKLSSKNNLNF